MRRCVEKLMKMSLGTALPLLALFSFWTGPNPVQGSLLPSATDQCTVTLHVRDIYPPRAVTDLAAAVSANEGELLLMWTAPDSNNLSVPSQQAVQSYQVRYATFSVSSLAGNSTAWWNLAASASGAPSPPQPRGSPESFILSNLEPGATLYFGIKSVDAAGNVSSIDALASSPLLQAKALVPDLPPPKVQGVALSASSNTLTLSWNASTATDVTSYRIYWDTTAPADVFVPTVTVPLGTTYYAFNNLVAANTYFFYVTALDKGLPNFLGNVLESTPSAIVSNFTIVVQPPKAKLLEPTGVAGALRPDGKFDLQWSPVTMDVNRSTSIDLAGYHVYKSSAVEGPFSLRAAVSSTTLSWTSLEAVPPAVWYLVRSLDSTGQESADSLRIQTVAAPTLAAASADETAHLLFPGADAQMLRAATNGLQEDVRLVVRRVPEDEKGNVLESYDVRSYGAVSGAEIPDLKILRPEVQLSFRYQSGISGAPLPAIARLSPITIGTSKDVSIYWNNLYEFVKFGGDVDEFAGTISLRTAKPLGRFQVRNVLRASDLELTQLTPRKTFTPNGDGVNDDITLFLENPKGSAIAQAKIYDLTGAEVADFQQGLVAGNAGVISLKWDGRNHAGNYVRSGIYIYQIQSEGKVINGTIVVAR